MPGGIDDMSARTLLISTACLWGLLACGTDPDDLGRCDTNIDVVVSSGENPVFAWTPANCQMYEISVTEDQQVRWLLASQDYVNRLSSPLRYGQSVEGIPNGGSDPLYAGFFYNVVLLRVGENGLPQQVFSGRFQHEAE
jgi:hypothetical protein